ncbi:DinB family protein [Streptomyces fuscigenes]|uniref:DinB family protein n=1 Tax=Streptomyces fuscigenes TaxID=1528880 RepID=UPI001F323FF2|nr:DinB family protein [Streptomyces fuscigenes]MCF3964345.1 DinB family protein [Streptomyces fuscigenes]
MDPLSPVPAGPGDGTDHGGSHAARVAAATGEREALCAFLDRQRDALTRKLDGLTEEQARSAPTAGTLTLLGLLRHAAIWERRWFQIVFEGRVFPGEWPEVPKSEFNDEDFVLDGHDTVGLCRERYAAEVARSRRIAAEAALDTRCARREFEELTLRWVLLHMIEETARHAGHADIIRESLDGTTGL